MRSSTAIQMQWRSNMEVRTWVARFRQFVKDLSNVHADAQQGRVARGTGANGSRLTDGELPRRADTPAPKRKQRTIKCVKQGGRRLYGDVLECGWLKYGSFR